MQRSALLTPIRGGRSARIHPASSPALTQAVHNGSHPLQRPTGNYLVAERERTLRAKVSCKVVPRKWGGWVGWSREEMRVVVCVVVAPLEEQNALAVCRL